MKKHKTNKTIESSIKDKVVTKSLKVKDVIDCVDSDGLMISEMVGWEDMHSIADTIMKAITEKFEIEEEERCESTGREGGLEILFKTEIPDEKWEEFCNFIGWEHI